MLTHWEKIKAVQRMQDFIEEHITTPITLTMLAKAARYSPWHAARIFKELTDKTPFEYIRARRLSLAAVQLQEGKSKIIDVAFDFVFDSHEGFTRAFSKQFGMTPRFFAKNTPSLELFMPRHARDLYLSMQKGEKNMSQTTPAKTVFVQVVDRPARKLILKRGIQATHYFEYCDEVGCEVWEQLTNIKEAIHEPIGVWLPQTLQKSGTSQYVQGVEVDRNFKGQIPTGFEVIDLPPCKMMVFQGEPFDDAKFEDAIMNLWDTMKTYDPKTYGFNWDDDGLRFQLMPMGYRGYIEARGVKQVNS